MNIKQSEVKNEEDQKIQDSEFNCPYIKLTKQGSCNGETDALTYEDIYDGWCLGKRCYDNTTIEKLAKQNVPKDPFTNRQLDNDELKQSNLESQLERDELKQNILESQLERDGSLLQTFMQQLQLREERYNEELYQRSVIDPITGGRVLPRGKHNKLKCEMFKLYYSNRNLFKNANETESKIKNPLSGRMVLKNKKLGKIIMKLKKADR